jgi:hypothetical protein
MGHLCGDVLAPFALAAELAWLTLREAEAEAASEGHYYYRRTLQCTRTEPGKTPTTAGARYATTQNTPELLLAMARAPSPE